MSPCQNRAEDKQHSELVTNQCSPQLDTLLQNYHFDIVCLTRREFATRGITCRVLERLARRVPLVLPWAPAYNALRQNVNRRFNVFPLMLVLARSDHHVVAAVRFARRHGIQLAGRGGAHSAEGYSLCSGMVIDQSQRRGLALRETAATGLGLGRDGDVDMVLAEVEAGHTNGSLVPALAKRGLALPAGTCPSVGIAGLALGGGVGPLMRRYGLTCDNLIALRMVDARGQIVCASAEQNQDLFWASRGGGGGNFGLVVAFTFRVYPVATVITYRLVYPATQMATVLDAWQRWAPSATDDVSSVISLRPREVRVFGFYLGASRAALKALLEHSLPAPQSREVHRVSYIDAARFIAGPPDRMPYFKVKSNLVRRLWARPAFETIARFLATAPPDSRFDLEALGGAVNRVAPAATAFPYRRELFWGEFVTLWSNAQDAAQHQRWAQEFHAAMEPFALPGQAGYVNVVDAELRDYLQAYYGDNKRRLIEVKRCVDPANVFHFPQSIPLTATQPNPT